MIPDKIDMGLFEYILPEERIALYPAQPRSNSKLLMYDQGNISHHTFSGITNLLPPDSLLVFNQTKVIQARIKVKKTTGAEIEIFLLEPLNESIPQTISSKYSTTWKCMVGNKRKWKEDEILNIDQVQCSWINREENVIQLTWENEFIFAEILSRIGNIPIPPYINRAAEESDKENYQTVYSSVEGSVAAPTAGLHFTEEILEELSAQGIQKEFITLHVGAGTFKPVETSNALEHEMHEENFFVELSTIKNLLKHHGNIIPVGTTSMRTLESLYWIGVGLHLNKVNPLRVEQFYPYQCKEQNLSLQSSLEAIIDYMDKNHLQTMEARTGIYIVPGYRFRMCNGLITNFHQPGSTLLLLVAALIGNDWKKVYQSAMDNDYRFLSFGDSSYLKPL